MTRIDYNRVAPEGVKAVRAIDKYLHASHLEPALIELVKVRASLMNGRAYCVGKKLRERTSDRDISAAPQCQKGQIAEVIAPLEAGVRKPIPEFRSGPKVPDEIPHPDSSI